MADDGKHIIMSPSASASNPGLLMAAARPMKRRWLLRLAAATALVVAAVVARPIVHVGWAWWGDREERVSVPAGFADDASRLNRTPIREVWAPAGNTADAEAQLAALLQRAHAEGLPVAIAGARHSMGGHTICADGVILDMGQWHRMELDEATDILHVQAGARWSEVLPYLDARGRSVAVMQSNNSFSVGGSISVNCHGWQYDRPPIASTVEGFRLMLADGTIRNCSRTENAELFSLVLGGYGLFGVILDVELRVVPNELYRLEKRVVPAADALAAFDDLVQREPPVQMIYARFNIDPKHFLEDVVIGGYFSVEGAPPPLTGTPAGWLERTVFRGSVGSDYGKALRWRAETRLQPLLAKASYSRNELLNEEVAVYENRTADTADVLHEYFLPRDGLPDFVATLQTVIPGSGVDLLNVTVRSVNEDTDTFLRYADQPMIALVMLFVQPKTDDGERRMRALSAQLIEAAIAGGGRYYLPYRLATPDQFYRAYPQAAAFFEKKRQYDPDGVFQNQFYRAYAQAVTE